MSLLAMIDEIDTLITNSAAPAIVKPKLYTLREQTQALEREATQLQIRNDELQRLYADAEKTIADLKAQIAKIESPNDPSATDQCPYCKRHKGKLIDTKPSKHFGEFGEKVLYFCCTNPECGKEYDRTESPPPPPRDEWRGGSRGRR